MANAYELWLQAQEACASIAPEVGAATGAMYGLGAESVTANPLFAAAVSKTIEDYVSNNWQHTCALPTNITNSISDALAPSADGPSGGSTDNSISPDM